MFKAFAKHITNRNAVRLRQVFRLEKEGAEALACVTRKENKKTKTNQDSKKASEEKNKGSTKRTNKKYGRDKPPDEFKSGTPVSKKLGIRTKPSP